MSPKSKGGPCCDFLTSPLFHCRRPAFFRLPTLFTLFRRAVTQSLALDGGWGSFNSGRQMTAFLKPWKAQRRVREAYGEETAASTG